MSKRALCHDYIDVWQSRVDLPRAQIQAYAELLSEAELQRAAKFSFADKYDEFVVTRGLLRSALAEVLKKPPQAFEITPAENNKPALTENVGGQAVVFNVSHSHGLALVALSLDRQLGIDVEKIRADVEYMKLARRFFSSAEYEGLTQYSGDAVEAFFAIWTRKEAFVKALGKGIAFGLSEFDVNVDPHAAARMLVTRWQQDAVHHWHLQDIDIASGYRACVAAGGSAFQVRFRR